MFFSISICPPNGLSEEGRWLAILLFTQGVLTAACIAWNNHGLATRRVKAARAIQLKPKEGLSLGRRARLCCGCSVRGRQEGCCQSGPASSRIMLSVLSRMKDTINVCRPERPNSHATSGIERERTLQQPSWMTFARLSVNWRKTGVSPCASFRWVPGPDDEAHWPLLVHSVHLPWPAVRCTVTLSFHPWCACVVCFLCVLCLLSHLCSDNASIASTRHLASSCFGLTWLKLTAPYVSFTPALCCAPTSPQDRGRPVYSRLGPHAVLACGPTVME